MTLIEVVAGMVVLGTVLALILTARNRYTRQLLIADQRVKAAAAVDDLVAGWLGGERPAVPLNGAGELATDYPMVWSTRVLGDRDAAALGARVVRLDVYAVAQQKRVRRATGAAAEPVLTLDLLVPGPRRAGEAIAGATGDDGDGGDGGDAATPPAADAGMAAAPTSRPTDDPITFEDPRVERGVP